MILKFQVNARDYSFTLGFPPMLVSLNAIATLWSRLNHKHKPVQLVNLIAGEGIHNFMVIRSMECLHIPFSISLSL